MFFGWQLELADIVIVAHNNIIYLLWKHHRSLLSHAMRSPGAATTENYVPVDH